MNDDLAVAFRNSIEMMEQLEFLVIEYLSVAYQSTVVEHQRLVPLVGEIVDLQTAELHVHTVVLVCGKVIGTSMGERVLISNVFSIVEKEIDTAHFSIGCFVYVE